MELAKAHSEVSLAAHLYHGWTILSVHCDEATGGVSEHVLHWELPESPRRPSSGELQRFVHVSNIEDKFEISRRGIVIAPGLTRDKAGLLRHESIIVLFDYQQTALLAYVRSIELSSPPSPKGWAILLPSEISSDQIQIGMQVWVRDERPDWTPQGSSMSSRGCREERAIPPVTHSRNLNPAGVVPSSRAITVAGPRAIAAHTTAPVLPTLRQTF